MLDYPALSTAHAADLENRLFDFESVWLAGRTPTIADYLPPHDAPHRLAILCEMIVVDREFRQRRELPIPNYAELYPDEAHQPLFYAALVHQEEPPRGVGRYELGILLGQGSFGKVYRGWDTELRRLVAIKIPHQTAFLTAQDSERFLREAHCAADVQHPQIVTLYDVGRTTDLPYLVYQFVEGPSLAEWLLDHTLNHRQAAELVALLAVAVDYAHQQGIIHRDLKPANILLSGNDLTTAKISDFGSARRSTDATLTQTGHLQGTPAYMAPEQALGLRTTDARTDVYALGVILYQLLTGQLPFRGEQVLVLRQIVDVDPTPPRKLNRAVARDLDTICLKCLSKEPAMRYQTAAELAADLRRWLQGEPISARPLGYMGRVTRWVKREPRLAASLAALFIVLSLCLTAVTALYLHARTQTRLAEQGQREAMDVVDEYLTKVAESELLDRPGMQPLRKELAEAALARYRQYLERQTDDPQVRAALASSWYRVGYLTYTIGSERDAKEAFDHARVLQEQLIRTDTQPEYQAELGATYYFLGLLASRFGESDNALRWLEQARVLQEPLCRSADRETALIIEYAATLRAIGRVHIDFGDPRTGLPLLTQADAILAPLGTSADVAGLRTIIHYERMTSYRGLGHLHSALPALKQAEVILQSATPDRIKRSRRTTTLHLTNFERERWQGNIDNGFGLLYMGMQELSKAKQAFQMAVDRRQQLAKDNPTVTGYQAELASALMNLSIVEEVLGELDSALPRRERAAKIYGELVVANPELFHLRDTGSYVHHILADTYVRQQRQPDAIRILGRLCDLWAALPSLGPQERLSLADANSKVATWSAEIGNPQPDRLVQARQQYMELRTTLLEQRATQQAALAKQPERGTLRHDLSVTLEQLGATEFGLTNYAQAMTYAQERLALWPNNPREQVRAATSYIRYALAAQAPTTLGDSALESAITAGFDDRGWLRMEMLRYPTLDRPHFRQQMASLASKP